MYMNFGGTMLTRRNDMMVWLTSGTYAQNLILTQWPLTTLMKMTINYQDTPFEAQQLQGTISDAIVWQEVNLNYEPESASTAVENTQAFDDIVRYQYGVCIPPGLYPCIHLTNRPEWKETHHIIGNKCTELQDRRLQEATRDIVQCLLDVGKGLVTMIPSLLWDLNQHNHQYLYN